MIELLNIDCMEYMATQPDKSFDLAIVDPPYGIGDFNQTASKKFHKKITWNETIPGEEYFAELSRVSINQIIWGANYYGFPLGKGVIVHDKTGGNRRGMPKELSTCDIASHSFGINQKIFHYMWCGNVSEKGIDWNNKNKIHPCMKPVELYDWILTNYAKPGQRILDTHLGSGSSAIASHYFGCDFVGCEIDEDYYRAAKERFDHETRQVALL